MTVITRLYEMVTGRPWTTVRSMAAEYGPPPGARYADQLAAYTDTELIRDGHRILTRLREQDAAVPTVNPAWAGSCRCEDKEMHDPDCRQGHGPGCDVDCWSPTGCRNRYAAITGVEAVAP